VCVCVCVCVLERGNEKGKCAKCLHLAGRGLLLLSNKTSPDFTLAVGCVSSSNLPPRHPYRHHKSWLWMDGMNPRENEQAQISGRVHLVPSPVLSPAGILVRLLLGCLCGEWVRRSRGLQELRRNTVSCRQAGFMMLPLTLKGSSVCLVPANYFAWPAPVHVHSQ